MNKLSIGVQCALKIAAMEAVAARCQYIEKEHIFIGICSIEKILTMDSLKDKNSLTIRQELNVENNSVKDVLCGMKLDATLLRREVRAMIDKGNHKHTEKVVHRSEACKKVFDRTNELTLSNREPSCIHLLAAILERPGKAIRSVLNEAGVKPEALCQRALVCTSMKKEKKEEELLHEADFESIHNMLITGLEKKFDELQ